FVPINFANVDEFLRRLPRSHRRDLRRKLKARDALDIEWINTGERFSDTSLVEELYRQYLAVYQRSKYQFDKLTYDFFQSVLTSRTNDGLVCLYRKDGKVIGHNLCFLYNGNLIDKYVGFCYPDAREFNLYFISWLENIQYAASKRLMFYIAGCAAPEL